jgi:protocatechuate 3,4-dioxygenase beta subunit
MRPIALSFVLLVGLGATVGSQAPQAGQQVQQPPAQPSSPQRMPARPLRPGEEPPKGTAVLKGQVLASTGGPVRRAQVRAMSMEGRGGGVTSTDSEGRYEIKELAAGRYNITAGKGGFVQGNYGQRRAGEPGTPIDLSDGQTADKVNFVLSRGSVIAGKIVDDGGEPVSGTMVAAVRYQFMAGTRRLVPGGGEGSTDRTDDQGNFRLFGLPPGDYYVSASNRSTMMMQGVNNTEADGFAPTYFPGTPNIAEATRVTVRAGQEMTGASFALIVARMAKVRGRAMNSHGEPVSNAMLMLMPDEPVVMPMNFNNAMAAGDGTFQFANVPPGRYNLQVRPSGMPSATSEFATLKVTVGNDDIDNLIVITSAGLTARGVVLTDDGSVPTFRASQVSIFAQPAEPGSMMMGPGQNRVNDDYTFELTSLSDRRLIRANVGGQTLSWYLKAVMLDGEDVTDSGIEFTPGRSYDGLQIILSQKATDLSGLVSDDRGKPVVDATVVIFPANRDLWTYSSRYMRTTRPDTNGRYSVKWLPPLEDYLIIAVQNLEQGQGGDPEFLSRAAEQAKRLSLNEGELKALDITLSKLVP